MAEGAEEDGELIDTVVVGGPHTITSEFKVVLSGQGDWAKNALDIPLPNYKCKYFVFSQSIKCDLCNTLPKTYGGKCFPQIQIDQYTGNVLSKMLVISYLAFCVHGDHTLLLRDEFSVMELPHSTLMYVTNDRPPSPACVARGRQRPEEGSAASGPAAGGT